MEKKKDMKRSNTILLVSLLVILLLAGCQAGQTDNTPTATIDQLPATEVPTETPTQQIVEQRRPPEVILLAGSESYQSRAADYKPVLEAALGTRGLRFEDWMSFSLDDATPDLEMIIIVGEHPELAAFVAALPEVQFLVLEAPGVVPGPNLTVVNNSQARAVDQAFMAGYIAAVESDEWRIGVISVNDPAGVQYRKAFLNGAIYFCGECNPIYPPFNDYPAYAEVSPGAGLDQLQLAANSLLALGVDFIHIAPELQSAELYLYLAGQDLRIVGTDAPPPGLEGKWVASVTIAPSMGIAEVIGAILDNGAQGALGTSIKIDYTAASQARLSHFNGILEQLETGQIDPVGEVVD